MLEKFAIKVLEMIIPVISPELKKEMDEGIKRLEAQANKTPNKFDDILVGLIKTLLNV